MGWSVARWPVSQLDFCINFRAYEHASWIVVLCHVQCVVHACRTCFSKRHILSCSVYFFLFPAAVATFENFEQAKKNSLASRSDISTFISWFLKCLCHWISDFFSFFHPRSFSPASPIWPVMPLALGRPRRDRARGRLIAICQWIDRRIAIARVHQYAHADTCVCCFKILYMCLLTFCINFSHTRDTLCFCRFPFFCHDSSAESFWLDARETEKIAKNFHGLFWHVIACTWPVCARKVS